MILIYLFLVMFVPNYYYCNNMRYSVIVPVYNRPDEVKELLESLTEQHFKDFEVIIVEDGSTLPCNDIIEIFKDRLDIKYFSKPNSGPGQTRNYGAERSSGEYLIILDSDCIVPPVYFNSIEQELTESPSDAFGGPDKAHHSFTDIQKAINYSMTSFFTTGGIRGGEKKMDKFYPRSFNMGVRRNVYMSLGGFSDMRFGEDIDFSIRIFKGGYSCRLFPEAWVWHKRRTDMKKFFKQVYNSGIARINLYKKYPDSLKPVHMLPAIFTAGMIVLILAAAVGCMMYVFSHFSNDANSKYIVEKWALYIISASIMPLAVFSLLIFSDSAIKNKCIKIGAFSIISSFIQLTGYGSGFIIAWWKRCILGKDQFSAFEKNFYK